jgi:glycosyltransferase involved in cell wall biosynthesis
LQSQVKQLQLGARVIFAGQVDEPERWMGAMDVFALPSTANEGVPQALLQAMASALACVTTPVGAIEEVARHGQTAMLVPPEQTAPLAQALNFLLERPEQRARLGAEARRLVSCQFDLRVMANRMEALFTWAAAQRMSGR